MCTFGLSGCRVNLQRLWDGVKEAGERAQLTLQTPPKLHEKTPETGRKE